MFELTPSPSLLFFFSTLYRSRAAESGQPNCDGTADVTRPRGEWWPFWSEKCHQKVFGKIFLILALFSLSRSLLTYARLRPQPCVCTRHWRLRQRYIQTDGLEWRDRLGKSRGQQAVSLLLFIFSFSLLFFFSHFFFSSCPFYLCQEVGPVQRVGRGGTDTDETGTGCTVWDLFGCCVFSLVATSAERYVVLFVLSTVLFYSSHSSSSFDYYFICQVVGLAEPMSSWVQQRIGRGRTGAQRKWYQSELTPTRMITDCCENIILTHPAGYPLKPLHSQM